MTRIYDIKETQWGFDVVGPNGHRWVCPNGETRLKAIATARAFERAFFEGTKSVSDDADLIAILTALASMSETPTEADVSRIALLKAPATKLLRKIERMRYIVQSRLKDKKIAVPLATREPDENRGNR